METAVPLALGSLSFFHLRHTLQDGSELFARTKTDSEAWLLALSGHWFNCRVESLGQSLFIRQADEGISAGMSGSPIIAPDERAIGIVCLSTGAHPENCREGGPDPFLPANLPGWLAGDLLKIRAPLKTQSSGCGLA